MENLPDILEPLIGSDLQSKEKDLPLEGSEGSPSMSNNVGCFRHTGITTSVTRSGLQYRTVG